MGDDAGAGVGAGAFKTVEQATAMLNFEVKQAALSGGLGRGDAGRQSPWQHLGDEKLT